MSSATSPRRKPSTRRRVGAGQAQFIRYEARTAQHEEGAQLAAPLEILGFVKIDFEIQHDRGAFRCHECGLATS